jgi:D-cysteine desulfhydrase
MSLQLPTRLDVATLPTRTRKLTRTSARLGGPTLWVKHDDETGSILTGNKIRKLQYAVQAAIDAGADTLVTCGGAQSNHCRTTAALARRLGLHPVLCLRGPVPDSLCGNMLLDHLLQAEIRWWSAEEYRDHAHGLAAVAEQLRAAGRRPFVIAEGCSMPEGVLGYVEAAWEIAQSETRLGVTFDAVVHAVGSGGTTAGLVLGARALSLQAAIVGIPVCDDAAWFRPRIARLIEDTAARFDLPGNIDPVTLDLVDGFVGDGYGLAAPEVLASLRAAARDDGLVLEPVYTGKAWYALVEHLVRTRFAEAEHVLFLHTGGIFGLAPYADALR